MGWLNTQMLTFTELPPSISLLNRQHSKFLLWILNYLYKVKPNDDELFLLCWYSGAFVLILWESNKYLLLTSFIIITGTYQLRESSLWRLELPTNNNDIQHTSMSKPYPSLQLTSPMWDIFLQRFVFPYECETYVLVWAVKMTSNAWVELTYCTEDF